MVVRCEFGARFGVAASDLVTVQHWLAGRGLHVNFVYPSRMIIDFSGTPGPVKAAFRTGDGDGNVLLGA